MSEEEDAAAILNSMVVINASTAGIAAALSGMTPKQKNDTRSDLEAAVYCMNNAMQSAGIS